MQVNQRELGPCRLALDFEVEAERFHEAVQKVTEEYLRHMSIPGFRKGRAPRQLALRYLNQDLVNERAAFEVIGGVLDEYLDDAGVELYKPIDPDEDITDVQYPQGEGPLRFTLTLVTKPRVELGPYKGLRFEHKTIEVTDEDVDNAVREQLRSRAELRTVEGPVQLGDWVALQPKGSDETETPRMMIADSDLAPFGDRLIGLKPGDEVALPGADTGQEERFVVRDIKRWEVPELTDEVAQQIGNCKSAEEFRTSVRRELEHRAQGLSEAELESRMIDTVVASCKVEMPDELVDRVVAERTADIVRSLEEEGKNLQSYLVETKRTFSQFQDDLRMRAERNIKRFLVARAIADAEGIPIPRGDTGEPGEGGEDEENKPENDLLSKVVAFLKANNEIVLIGADSAGESQ
ncbi:MAG: trigger factor [Armatimonadota bacterium]